MPDVPPIDLVGIALALRGDDVDAAIRLGLLDWPGDAASADRAGLEPADIALILRVRGERLAALAARERHRVRDARLARLQAERRQRQSESLSMGDATRPPALGGAAAAALARALAKAKR